MTTPFRLLALSAAALGLASCQSPKSNADPYASNAAGGGYNPYPDQGGYATNAPAPSYAPRSIPVVVMTFRCHVPTSSLTACGPDCDCVFPSSWEF